MIRKSFFIVVALLLMIQPIPLNFISNIRSNFMRKTIIIISFVLMLPALSLARSISFPFTESLDTNNYSDIRFVSAADGSTFEHRTTGCWSGQCARFTPPTSQTTQTSRRAGITGLQFSAGAQSVVYIRWLFRTSSDFEEDVSNRGYGYQDKILIVTPTSGNRGMSIYENCTSVACGNQDYYTPGACIDNSCTYESTEGTSRTQPQGTDSFKSEDYEETWICYEVKIDATNDTSEVYITTQDGVMSGAYIDRDGTLNNMTGIEGIGWYFNGYYSGSAWFEIDEIAVDDEYIGPPIGFVTGSDETAPTIESCIVDADGVTVYVGLSEGVTTANGYDTGDLHFDCSVTGTVNLAYSSGNGNAQLIFTAQSTIQASDVCDLDYSGTTDEIEDTSGNDLAAADDIIDPVTNNSNQGHTPTFSGCSFD